MKKLALHNVFIFVKFNTTCPILFAHACNLRVHLLKSSLYERLRQQRSYRQRQTLSMMNRKISRKQALIAALKFQYLLRPWKHLVCPTLQAAALWYRIAGRHHGFPPVLNYWYKSAHRIPLLYPSRRIRKIQECYSWRKRNLLWWMAR